MPKKPKLASEGNVATKLHASRASNCISDIQIKAFLKSRLLKEKESTKVKEYEKRILELEHQVSKYKQMLNAVADDADKNEKECIVDLEWQSFQSNFICVDTDFVLNQVESFQKMKREYASAVDANFKAVQGILDMSKEMNENGLRIKEMCMMLENALK